MNDGKRGQQAFAPDMAGPFARFRDHGFVEVKVDILPNLSERDINPPMHPRGLLSHGSCDNPMIGRRPGFSSTHSRLAG